MNGKLLFFVIAPAWQLFLLLFSPLILATILSSIVESAFPMQFGIFISLCMDQLWIYSVCTYFSYKYSSNLTVPIVRLKVCLSYNIVYAILFSFSTIPFDYLEFIHLIAFCSNVYCIYFLAKLLVMVEKKSKVRFNDYIGTFFAAYVLLIGIWYLQPRINRVL